MSSGAPFGHGANQKSARFNNLLAPSAGRHHSAAGRCNRGDLASERYVLEPPPDVIALPGSKSYPDFFPWHKSEEEDKLSTDYVQKGYYPSSQVMNEYGSARNSLLPLFKQWTSLPALQYFLYKSMEVREKKCRIATASTFKPPPRVTLTDQKREAWLRDLASPSVPLRKLSRTIPHGIRNRGLLEQCCNKAIPIPRAVWFARCVGANELRGLKRKGASAPGNNEAGWIRDWTEEVIEFIEKTVRDFGSTTEMMNNNAAPAAPAAAAAPVGKPQPKHQHQHQSSKPEVKSWRFRIEYLTRFLAHLFHENLVDRGLVLRWTLRFFQKAHPEELPVALIYINLFWGDLSASRAFSQSLAHTLLKQYAALSSERSSSGTSQVFETLLDKVSTSIEQLFVISPDSFVIPRHWRTLAPVLIEAIKSDSPKVQELLETVRVRNENLIVSDAPLVRSQRDHRAVLVKYLDQLAPPFELSGFVKLVTPWRLDDSDILEVVFQWCCTKASTNGNVLVALVLCRYLQTVRRWDVSSALQRFLVSIRNVDLYNMDSVHNLVHEFVLEDVLLLENYFRAVISSGILFIDRLRSEASGQIAILQNIDLDEFIPGYRIQRNMLLKGINCFDEALEQKELEETKHLVRKRLIFLFDEDDEASGDYLDLSSTEESILKKLLKCNKVRLADWLVEMLDARIKEDDWIPMLQQFSVVERILVALDATRQLYSAILLVLPKVGSGLFLYSLANTVRAYLVSFCTFGNIADVMQLFIIQYKALKAKSRISKGLFDLVQFALHQADIFSPELKGELEAILKPSVGGASPLDISKLSPMSENVDASFICYYDINEQTLNDLGIGIEPIDARALPGHFETVSAHFLEACSCGDAESARKYVKVLQHLRDGDLHVYNEVLTKWVRDQVEPQLESNHSTFLVLLIMLVVYECITFEKVADIFMQLQSVKASSSASLTRLMIDLVSRKTFDAIALRASERISLDFHRNVFESLHPKTYLRYLNSMLVEYSSQQMDFTAFLRSSDAVIRFLVGISSRDVSLFISVFVDPIVKNAGTGTDLAQIRELRQVIRCLIGSDIPDSGSLADHILAVATIVNVFNCQLFQVYMRVLLRSVQLEPRSAILPNSVLSVDNVASPALNPSSAEPYSEDEAISAIVEAAARSNTDSVNLKSTIGDLMVYLEKELKGKLLIYTELCFLESEKFPRYSLMDGKNAVSAIFEIVDAVADSAMENVLTNHAAAVVKCLDQLVQLSEEKATSNGEDKNNNGDDDKADEVDDGMEIDEALPESSGATSEDIHDAITFFVKIAIIHCQTFAPENLALRDRLMNGLLALMETPFVINSTELSGLLMDTLNIIKGEISDGSVSTPSSNKANTPTNVTAKLLKPKASPINVTQAPTSAGNSPVPDQSQSHSWKSDMGQSSYLNDLMIFDTSSDNYSEFNVRSFDLLEDPNPTMTTNDVPLSLRLFDCTIETYNPS
ncbi:hypothetical protein TRVA0_042S00298 [Trichomonascus vanleenenianus]|uniref:Srb8p n=1 Tax=Trichomonascus vanleenenianus TaxID=2268995 RepID=UPI003EC9A28C